VQEDVALADQAGVDDRARHLGDGVVGDRHDDSGRLEEKVGRRGREAGDAGNAGSDADGVGTATPQPEDGNAGVAEGAAERGRDRSGADDEDLWSGGGHGRKSPFVCR
jgi:hypothetical protein